MKKLSGRMTFLLILGIFGLPLVLAWMMYTGAVPFRADGTRNQGHLVVPLVPIKWATDRQEGGWDADSTFAGFWVVVFRPELPCESGCRQLLENLRQVHRAAGKDQLRVKLAIVLDSAQDETELQRMRDIYPRFFLVDKPDAEIFRTLDAAIHNSDAPAGSANLYLVDPLGNIMMVYSDEDAPSGLSKDLKRLLTWSQLDKSQGVVH